MIIILLFLLSLPAFAKDSAPAQSFYLGGGVAKSRYYNERIQSYGSRGAGHSFNFHGGYRSGPMALEPFIHYMSTRTEPMQFRGNQRYYLLTKNVSYGALAKLYVRTFNFRFGYAFHHFNLQLKPDTPGPEIEDPILSSEFGEMEKPRAGGTLFGVGMDLPIGGFIPYFAATSYQVSSSKSTFIEFEFGLNFKI